MEPLGNRLWYGNFPLTLLGVDMGRSVSAMRLESGDLVIHSTAPFSEEDAASIRSLGTPRWITDPMVDHDTFAREGCEALPEAHYLAPEGMNDFGKPVYPLMPPPEAWNGEIEVLPIEGAPGFNEHAFFHCPSRTLIVCDLLMHFTDRRALHERVLLRLALGKHRAPGTSRRLKLAIRDAEAFRESIARLMEWDFTQVIVGHGKPLREKARERTREAFEQAGWM